MHRIGETYGEAGARALEAGIDVELPDTLCYGESLAELVRAGAVPEDLVDRAVRRVLRQKVEQGLLEADFDPDTHTADEPVDLDPPEHRALARALAEQSVVLLDNRAGILPLTAGTASLALVGPCADDPNAFFGCYSFPNHVLPHHPGHDNGVEAHSLLDALTTELPGTLIAHEQGCPVKEADRDGIDAAVAAARNAAVRRRARAANGAPRSRSRHWGVPLATGSRATPPRPAQPTTAARTHSTSGRCDANCRQLSPSSADAYTSPLRLPKYTPAGSASSVHIASRSTVP